MGDCNHWTHERALTVPDDVTVVFHKVDSHGENSGDLDECVEDEHTAERIHLRSNPRRVSTSDCEDDAEGQEEATGIENSPEGSEKKTLCPPAFCIRNEPATREGRREHALS